jgi:hypothetical protein
MTELVAEDRRTALDTREEVYLPAAYRVELRRGDTRPPVAAPACQMACEIESYKVEIAVVIFAGVCEAKVYSLPSTFTVNARADKPTDIKTVVTAMSTAIAFIILPQTDVMLSFISIHLFLYRSFIFRYYSTKIIH